MFSETVTLPPFALILIVPSPIPVMYGNVVTWVASILI